MCAGPQVIQLRQKYTTLAVNYDKIQQDLKEVSEELIAQRQSLETKSRELVECQLKLKMAEDQKDSLQKALSTTEDKVVALRNDYLFLLQEKANLEGQLKHLLVALPLNNA